MTEQCEKNKPHVKMTADVLVLHSAEAQRSASVAVMT